MDHRPLAGTMAGERVQNLDLALVGNSTIAALIDADATDRLGLLPALRQRRPLLLAPARAQEDADFGFFAIDLADFAGAEQRYEPDTAIVVTTLRDSRGGAVEIVDFAPRFGASGACSARRCWCGRCGASRKPAHHGAAASRANYGESPPETTQGSNHIRFLTPSTCCGRRWIAP
jgi:hypothetical protein